MSVVNHGLSKVPMGGHYHLYPQGEMHQGYDQQPYQGDCDELPYYLRFRGVVGDCDAEVYGGGDDSEDSGSEDIPNPNNMGCSNHNTNCNCSDKG
jgi:hypothetical protein